MKDAFEVMSELTDAYTYRVDGVFIVDDIPYDWVWAENEIRPMIELIQDDEPDYACPLARWNPEPVTEAEMRTFLHSGMLDGRYLA